MTHLGELVFVGLGLNDDLGISLRALEETKTADHVFIELYTSFLPDFSIKRFAETSGKTPQTVMRKELEEKGGELILNSALVGKTVLLVPGDPLIATTHVALRILAEKRKIKTRIIHGASILSAAIGLSGLHNYKFGKSVTIPFPDDTPATTPYRVIGQNRKLGLHTLCFLDIKAEERRQLTINDGLRELMRIEAEKKENTILDDTIAVGVARAGSDRPDVKAGVVKDLLQHQFGMPPHTLIFPGRLHFMEVDALITLAGAPETLRRFSE
jgi:diphthine synthase